MKVISTCFDRSSPVHLGMHFLSFGLLFACYVPAAFAMEYHLTKGQGIEVCDAYEKKLNYFPNLPSAKGYLRGSHLTFVNTRGFEKPEIGRLNEQTRGTVLSKIDELLWKRDANPVYFFNEIIHGNWRGTPAQWAQARSGYDDQRSQRVSINYEHTRFDIDNDGTVDNIYLGSPNTGGRLLIVLNADQTDIDYQKTRLVMVHPSRKEQSLGEYRPYFPGEFRIPGLTEKRKVEDSLHHAHYDLFGYKGKTYFDLWWSHHPDFKGKPDHEAGRLRVYTIEHNKTREVCVYRFELR